MVYYRTYRPQAIGDLDSTGVRETLTRVLSGKNIPHAFLFTGPKGLGKTSTARIIAKAVNCTAPIKERKNGFEPCGTCDQCVSITNGSNIDVLEIDGASNRGIDEIRDLRERVHLSPSQAKKKVYIIDEVHMLTTEAFNALLKTIEEPPSHVMFIFCTTEPHKVPATILSRCFHVVFTSATDDEIVSSLERIVKGEKLDAERPALASIARMADGGFRDGTKLLEEIVSLAQGKKITQQLVEEKLHVTGVSNLVLELLSFLSERKAKSGLELITRVQAQGINMTYFAQQMVYVLHGFLLQKVGIVGEESPVGKKFSLEEVQALLQLFTEAIRQMKYAVIIQLPLELVIVSWCLEESSSDEKTAPILSVQPSGKHTMDTLRKKEQNLKVQSILHPQVKAEPVKKEQTVDQPDITAHANGEDMLMENIIYKVKQINASVAGVLRGCRIIETNDTEIVFEAAYKFHKERLEEAKTYAIIEKVVREITGKPLRVTVRLKK